MEVDGCIELLVLATCTSTKDAVYWIIWNLQKPQLTLPNLISERCVARVDLESYLSLGSATGYN